MTRVSKQGKVRNASPRRPKPPAVKTGPKRDKLEFGHKVHANAIAEAAGRFIPKVR